MSFAGCTLVGAARPSTPKHGLQPLEDVSGRESTALPDALGRALDAIARRGMVVVPVSSAASHSRIALS